MVSSAWANDTEKMIKELEVQRAEEVRQLQEAQEALEATEQTLVHLQASLDYHRHLNGLPKENAKVSVYASMGPTEFAIQWADKHGGEMVVKEAGLAYYESGAYPTQSDAYKMIGNIVSRHKDFVKVGRGHYRRKSNAGLMGLSA